MTINTFDLQMMNIDELRTQQAQWYAAAVSENKIQKCRTVVMVLGEQGPCGFSFTSSNNNLRIVKDDHTGHMFAEWKGQLVMSTHSTQKLFIPGQWFSGYVLAYYIKSVQRRDEEASDKKERERQTLIKQLTIEGE